MATGSPLRDSLDRKSAMDRSQIIADRTQELIARDHAMGRYRSKSPMHGGPVFEDVRQTQYHSRFGAELAGGVKYHRTSASNVAHLSPEPVGSHVQTRTHMVPGPDRVSTQAHTRYEPRQHTVMQPVHHQIMQPVDHYEQRQVVREVHRERIGVHSAQHQELFIAELSSEINEIKNRSRDFEALREQYKYLQEQYKEACMEKSRLEGDCLARIGQDRTEVDRLIRELDMVKSENIQAEDEQIKLLEMVAVTESEYIAKSSELNSLRQQSSIEDQTNLNLRKEIEYQDRLLVEQKEISHSHYQELTKLREIQFNIDKDIDITSKRYGILKNEIENNEQRIASISSLLAQKEDQFAQCLGRINESQKCIQEHKYSLNKLDSELGYLESTNEQHKCAQSQLFKANEYEYTQSKEMSLRMSELQVNYNKMEDEEKSLGYEINRLKAHSEQMMKDQVDLQAEVDALDKHMANLNNQNYCLQKELEAFIESDEAVRQGLDRKVKVETIRNKVDDVIRRSEQEVEERILEQKSRRVHADQVRVSNDQQRAAHERASAHQAAQQNAFHQDAMMRQEANARAEHFDRVNRAKSANHYSPVRHEQFDSRVAYRAEAEHNIQTRTFSSDQNRLGVHQYRPTQVVTADPRQARHSPLRREPVARDDPNKKVSFA